MNQKGFTLVELAIVLVIIGVILGGVIKGQELVTNARIKQLYRNYQQVEFAYFSYIDRFNDKPGDDSRQVTGIGGNGSSNAQGDEDGTIEGAWSSTTVTNESVRAWAHLRDAGYIKDGESDIDAHPVHAFGGMIGIEDGGLGMTGDIVCFAGIEADTAEAFDAQFDDGVGTTGRIRGRDTDNNVDSGAEAYAGDTTATTVCASLEN